jgi:hypothetical protein
MKSYRILLLLIILTACETTLTGYKFKINAVYEASVSGFKMSVASNGYVKSGSDMAETYEGRVIIESLAEADSKRKIILYFSSSSDELIYEIGSGGKLKAAWGFREDIKSMNNILRAAGYGNILVDEIRESIGAMGGALNGPKGVILDGQSKYIKVIEVDYGEKNN